MCIVLGITIEAQAKNMPGYTGWRACFEHAPVHVHAYVHIRVISYDPNSIRIFVGSA